MNMQFTPMRLLKDGLVSLLQLNDGTGKPTSPINQRTTALLEQLRQVPESDANVLDSYFDPERDRQQGQKLVLAGPGSMEDTSGHSGNDDQNWMEG